ncbi:MAG: hypothetical protein KAJ62_05910 [Desulfobacteraceae bacterium]|nr:hypothetical protein [Desulfobacteraceae bacterium]
MSPLFNSILSIAFILCAIGATFIMLELRGNPKARPSNIFLTKLHKILGWLFTCIFLFFLIIMIKKISGYNGEISARVSFHIVLSIALIPLLAVKLIIAHRYPRLSQNLITLGPFVLILAVTLTGITAGYYFIHSSDLKHISLNKSDTANILSQNQKIILTNKEENKTEKNFGRIIMETKCTSCHSIDRIVQATKSKKEWKITIGRMVNHTGDLNYLTTHEQKKLIDYFISL